jgi:hypothetical protein
MIGTLVTTDYPGGAKRILVITDLAINAFPTTRSFVIQSRGRKATSVTGELGKQILVRGRMRFVS